MKNTRSICISLVLAMLATLISGEPSVAGRPVTTHPTLADLVKEADAIAIVTKQLSVRRNPRNEYDCERHMLYFRIREILKTNRSLQLKSGMNIEVQNHITLFTDCTLRQGWKTSGASFPAKMYVGSRKNIVNTDRRSIVFFKRRNDMFELVADNAIESLDKHLQIKLMLKNSGRSK